MPTRNRSAVASVAAAPWIVAAGAIVAALATLFLLQPAVSGAAQASTVVSTANTGLGRILVNSRGHTLYAFGKDRNGKSSCTGMCASFWPPLIAAGKTHAAAGVKASLLGKTRRADGRMQVTYKGHPVYTFVQDKQKGQTKGEGVNAFGGVWHAISPAGNVVLKKSSSSGGGGYTP